MAEDMTGEEQTWTERVHVWLDSLEPDLRIAAEKVVDEYLNPTQYESPGTSEDWMPEPDENYAITVDFSREEIQLLSSGLSSDTNAIGLMKEMLLERSRAVLAERQNAESDATAAAD